MPFADVEDRVDRALKQLPPVRAPHTLLPRVMSVVHAWARRPWYERSWFTWPLALRAASIALFASLVVAMVFVAPIAQAASSSLSARMLSGALDDVSGAIDRTTITIEGARVLWRALVQPVLAYAAAIVALMYLACAAFALALNRAVFGRALHS